MKSAHREPVCKNLAPGMSHRSRIQSYESTFRMEESFYVSIDSSEITNGEFLATVDECSIVYQTKTVPILRRGCSLYPIIQVAFNSDAGGVSHYLR